MDDFDYELPAGSIAQQPAEPRDAARLLVGRADGTIDHRHVRDLPALLGPGDLLVVNDTRVIPARLPLRKPTGGAVEVLLLEPADGGQWRCLVRPARRVPVGTELHSERDPAVVVTVTGASEDGQRLVEVRRGDVVVATPHDALSLEEAGEMPLPPYITESTAPAGRYQTVYCDEPGSVAAPTAGLHLTRRLIDELAAAGVATATVQLVVGLDTFRPVTVDDPGDHVIHTEAYRVPEATMAACASARRVVAVGTTVVRALESAARGPLEGRTDLFLRRGARFEVVDVLLTNFHLPRSSLLLLVDAFVGPRWRALYDAALRAGYRFLSFGDAMLLERAPQ